MIPGPMALTTMRRGSDDSFDFEEAADALGLHYEIHRDGNVSFRTSDLPHMRAWLASRRTASAAAHRNSSGRPRKRKRLSPYEQAKADQQRKDEEERAQRDSIPPPLSPTKGQTMPPSKSTASVDDFVRANPRDAGFAGALAVAAAANGEPIQSGSSRTTQSGATPQISAKEEFRALVVAKLDARLKAKQRFKPNARLSQADTLRAQEEVHNEYPGLRERMIQEANVGQLGAVIGAPCRSGASRHC